MTGSPNRDDEDTLEILAPPTVLGRLARWAERMRVVRLALEAARRRHRSVDVALGTIERDSAIGGGMLGGALAYRLFVFLLPLALVLVALLGIYADASGETPAEVVQSSGLTGYVASQVSSAASTSSRWLILIVTLPALAYAAGMLYRAVALAHGLAWHRSARTAKLTGRGFLAFCGLALVQLTCVILVGAIRDSERLGLIAALLVYGVGLGGAWLAFSTLLPHDDVSWAALMPGALLIGVGMLAVNSFNVYVTAWLLEDREDTYGALGVAAALLFSLYLMGRLVVGSAVLSATISEQRRYGARATRALDMAPVVSVRPERAEPYVSTGSLPEASQVTRLVRAAHARYQARADGSLSQVYPALAAVPPGQFGICVVSVAGERYAVGDAEAEFTIMSVSKPFVFALACQALGPETMRDRLGVNATGLPFNALEAIERGHGRTNPMVNPGAIAATSLVPGGSAEARWNTILNGLSRFAGRRLAVDEDVHRSATETNARTHSIARLLSSYGRIYCDADEATDLYTRQCCLNVTATDLAVMGATLADGGVNPVTGERVVDAHTARHTLAVMTTAGLYESSGDWLYEVGLPGKSGIGGGIVTVAPGKGGLGTYSPLLDDVGNSVKGQLATRDLSRWLGLDLFVSEPRAEPGALDLNAT